MSGRMTKERLSALDGVVGKDAGNERWDVPVGDLFNIVEELSEEIRACWAELVALKSERKQVLADSEFALEAVIADSKAEREKDHEAMQEVYDMLGWHTNDDADENDTSPLDAVAHDNGLMRRKLRERLEAKR